MTHRSAGFRGVWVGAFVAVSMNAGGALAQEPSAVADPEAVAPAAEATTPTEPDAASAPDATETPAPQVAAPVIVATPVTAIVPATEALQVPEEQVTKPTFLETVMPEIHGFVSQGFIKSTENNYLANSEQGSFEFTEVGLNFTKQLTDRMRIGMQLFMRDLGPIGNYKPQFDWFYLDYRFFDWLGIRAGRTKIPFGLYNESQDIDSGRVPILLPQSVYPTGNRDFLLAQTGGEIYGDIPLGPVGSLEYRAYGGTIFIDQATVTAVQNVDVPFVVGGRLMWETPLDGLRLGATVQALRLQYDATLTPEQLADVIARGLVPPDSGSLVSVRFPVTLWVASAEYTVGDLMLAGEYSRWFSDIYSEPRGPNSIASTSERFYVMATYRAARWFSPGIYYAYLTPDVAMRDASNAHFATERHDLAVTARYDINDHWLFKLEAHYLHGTAELSPALNGGTEITQLAPDWGLFLAKTTAYF